MALKTCGNDSLELIFKLRTPTLAFFLQPYKIEHCRLPFCAFFEEATGIALEFSLTVAEVKSRCRQTGRLSGPEHSSAHALSSATASARELCAAQSSSSMPRYNLAPYGCQKNIL